MDVCDRGPDGDVRVEEILSGGGQPEEIATGGTRNQKAANKSEERGSRTGGIGSSGVRKRQAARPLCDPKAKNKKSLLEVESSASPTLKNISSKTMSARGKGRPSDAMETGGTTDGGAARSPPSTFTFEKFEKYMANNVAGPIAGIQAEIGAMRTDIDNNKQKMISNSILLSSHEARITVEEQGNAEIRERLAALESKVNPDGRLDDRGGWIPSDGLREGPYHRARRSLRLWPVGGTNDDELRNGVKIFLYRTLQMTTAEVDEEEIEDVRRIATPAGAPRKDEVVVTMTSAHSRDTVIGRSGKLADMRDRDGKSTAGIDIQVPTRLLDVFKTLEKYGRSMRMRHGPGTKRHVKFDDMEMSLYLNIKLPGDRFWTRVNPDMAKEGVRAALREEFVQLQKRPTPNAGDTPTARLARPMSEGGSSGRSQDWRPGSGRRGSTS